MRDYDGTSSIPNARGFRASTEVTFRQHQWGPRLLRVEYCNPGFILSITFSAERP